MSKLRLIRYLAPRVGETMKARIVHLVPYGFYVRAEESLIEGLVHVTSLGGDYYELDRERQQLVGQKRKKAFSIGDLIEVELFEVNAEAREITFTIPGKPRDRKRSGGKRGR